LIDALIEEIEKYEKLGFSHDIESMCKQALDIDPSNKKVLDKLTFHYFQKKEYDKSISLLDSYSHIFDSRTYLTNKALCLWHLENFKDALDLLNQLEIYYQSNSVSDWDFYFNRGIIHWSLNQYEEAKKDFGLANELNPQSVEPLQKLASLELDLGNYELCLDYLEKAIGLDPNNHATNLIKSFCFLQTGQWQEGWELYEYRPSIQDFLKQPYTAPYFTGVEDVQGKTILVVSEQGLGDTFLFARFLNPLAGRGAKIVFEVQKSCVPIFSEYGFIGQVVEKGTFNGHYDFVCPLASLINLLRIPVDRIPFRAGYLTANEKLLNKWKNILGDAAKLKIGITWAGEKVFGDWKRSINLKEFITALPEGPYEYICLHTNISEEDRSLLDQYNIKNYVELQTDFAETSALISNCDLVISTCTSIANLAGALGKRTWVLTQYAMDFRWFNGCPFYSSVTVYRQPIPGNWGPVLNQVNNDILKIINYE
jgi:lipoprotein NlpI